MKVKLAAFLLVSTVSCGDIQLPNSKEERDLIHANTPSATDTTNAFIVDAFLTPDQIINQKGINCLSGIRRA